MLRRIIIIGIGIVLIILVIVRAWPAAAQSMVRRITDSIGFVEHHTIALIGEQPSIKIVDPSALPAALGTVIKTEAPQVKAIFQKTAPENGDLVIEDIIDATNQERLKAGLQPLKVSAKLTQSAKLKTNDMIDNDYFEHTSPTGVTVSDLGARVGYSYLIMGENLALGNFTDADDLVAAWMASPGHRANILNAQYQDIGIYAAKGMYDGHEVWFAVQHFGTARSACPSIDAPLKQTIDSTNADLSREEQAIEALKSMIEASKPSDPGYNDNVNKFNTMVNAYNNELATSRGYIAQYNEQVRAFNACLSKYQATTE